MKLIGQVLLYTIPAMLLLTACFNDNGDSSGSSKGDGLYTVGGMVYGMNGTVIVQNNGGVNHKIISNGLFSLPASLATGAVYNVTILVHPVGQNCSVTNGVGAIEDADVTNVTINCVTNSYTVGGNLVNLSGSGFQLADTISGEVLNPASGDTAFSFPAIKHGNRYNVVVTGQPVNPDQTCTVNNGNSTVAGIDVTDILINCVTNTYTIGGTLGNLSGVGLQLTETVSGEVLNPARGDTGFSFPAVNFGSSYNVTVTGQPESPNQSCSVINGTGTVTGINITNVTVSCITSIYTLEGSINNYSGTGLQLTETVSGQVLNPTSGNTGFTFLAINDGSSYNVTVTGQPGGPNQLCSVSNGAGTVTGSAVTMITVICTNSYSVGGSISNLKGSGLRLTETFSGLVLSPANADSGFSFPLMEDSSSYNVTVTDQPADPGQVCNVGNGSGTITGANVSNITVSCVTNTYAVGGSLGNLSGTGLQLTETVSGYVLNPDSGDSAFSFPVLDDASSYNVTVTVQPGNPGQACAVSNGNGIITGANVGNIIINCVTNTYSVGGSLVNLTGTGLQLTETVSGQVLNPVSGDTGFTFPVVDDSSRYDVSVTGQPGSPAQFCNVSNGSGIITGINVTDITLSCVNIPEAPVISGLTLTNDNTPTWSWSPGGGGNGTYRYKLDDPDLSVSAFVTTLNTYTPPAALSDGAHILYVQEQNTAGYWSTSGIQTTTIDTVPPTILDKNPEDGSVDIALDAVISATFSEPVDTTTVTGSSFTLLDTDGNLINGSITFGNDNTVSSFTPTGRLGTVPVYTVTVTAAVTDLAGNALAVDETWSFDTIPGTVSCTTIIPGGLVAGQTWTAAGSPYCVTGNIQASLLALEPGTEVRVDGQYRIEVLSTLVAAGTQVDPVLISAKEPDAPISQRWKGLKFQNTPSGSELTHTVIEYSDDHGVTITNSTPVIRNSNIRNNTSPEHGGGVYAVLNTGQTLEISNTTFENNIANPSFAITPSGASAGGALYLSGGGAFIKNNKYIGNITYARCYGYFYCHATGRGGAVYIGASDSVVIENNEIFNNNVYASAKCYFASGTSRSYGGGLYINSGTVSLKNNIISGNAANLYGCWSGNAGSGVYVVGGTVTIENTTIVRNPGTTGIQHAGGTVDMSNSIIYFNNSNGTQIGGSPTVTYSDIQGGSAGTGNIDFNPVFTGISALPGDLKIVTGSPAIDAGNPDVIYDDICIPPSLGAVRNDMGAHGGPLACDW